LQQCLIFATSTAWVDEDTPQSSIVLGTFHFFTCAYLILATLFKMLASGE
jgi:hypothetical protein